MAEHEQKILWYDCETTGVLAEENGIVQIAGLVEVGGVVHEEFNLTCQPHPKDIVEDKALEVHGMDYETIMHFEDPTVVYFKLKRIFDKYVNPFDKNDKFVCGGKNIQFDKQFLYWFFKKNGTPHPKQGCAGDPFLFSYIGASDFDCQHMAVMLEMYRGEKLFPNFKLDTMCKVLGINLTKAHDAMSDIYATREVWYTIWNELTGWGSG